MKICLAFVGHAKALTNKVTGLVVDITKKELIKEGSDICTDSLN